MKKKFLMFTTIATIVFMSCSKDQMERPKIGQPEEFTGAANQGTNRGGGPTLSLSTALTAHFKFDGNLSDSSRQVAPGVPAYGTPIYTADRKGTINSAIKFDGTYGVNVGDIPLDSNMSISFWMKYEGTTRNAALFFVEGSHSFVFSQTENYKFMGGHWNYMTPVNFFTKSLFNDWHHVAATRDNNTFKFYIDGKLVGSKSFPTPGTPPVTTSDYLLGYGYNAGYKFWKGNLDDLRIYKKVLSSLEVNALANF